MIGSCFGGPFIMKGRRSAVFIISGIVYLGSGLTLIRTIPTIILGRFLHGFASAIFSLIMAKSIFETVPENQRGVFGGLTNILICFSGLLCLFMGLLLP
jgi:MFS family permease